MKFLLILFLVPLLVSPAFAQIEPQTLPTEKGTLNVDFSTTPPEIQPGDPVKFNIDFLNPNTEKIQEHIDYRVTVVKDGVNKWGPIPLTHTSSGSVTIPIGNVPEEGEYSALIEVEGILFQPIPLETVSFTFHVGEAAAETPTPTPQPSDEGGGCLIATAAYGSELAPQVQQLREIRDNIVLETESGSAFMQTFNEFYYSFSPIIADYERQNPIFKETVKISITPMLASLSIFNHVNIDSEDKMLGYGISVILLNLGMYLGIPTFAILKFYQFRRK